MASLGCPDSNSSTQHASKRIKVSHNINQVTVYYLPDEVLLNIMSCLNSVRDLAQCGAVSSGWRRVSDEILLKMTKTLKLTSGSLGEAEFLVKKSKKRFEECWIRCNAVNDDEFINLIRSKIFACPTLKTLTLHHRLRHCMRDEEYIEKLFSSPLLTLDNLHLEYLNAFTDKNLGRILSNMPNLKSLSMTDLMSHVDGSLTGSGLLKLNSSCFKKLSVLRMSYDKRYNMADFLHKFQGTLEFLEFDQMPKVSEYKKKMKLHSLTDLQFQPSFRDSFLEVDNWKEDLQWMFKSVPNLERFKMHSDTDGPDFCAIMIVLPHLVKNCKLLKFFEITCKSAWLGGDRKFIPERPVIDFGSLAKLKNLETLLVKIREYEYEEFPIAKGSNINFKSIAQITSLSTLSLECTAVSEDEALYLINNLKRLKSLNLSKCENISPEFARKHKDIVKYNFNVRKATRKSRLTKEDKESYALLLA
eukprot:sb/3464365/